MPHSSRPRWRCGTAPARPSRVGRGGVSRLVTGAVLKTVVTGHPGQAGSIPVRLRQQLLGRRALADPRRSTPRTDSVLADPALRAAATRLGPRIVKVAATAALERCRAG